MRYLFLAMLLLVPLVSCGQTGPGSCPTNTIVGNNGGGLTCLTGPQASGVIGAGATSVSNTDGTLTISPTIGAIIAGITQITSHTVLGNFSSGTSIPTAQQVPSCAGDGQHAITNSNFAGFACTAIAGTSASVLSVTASNTTLSIAPTTGAVLAQINLGNANTWTNSQTVPILAFVSAAANGINDESAVSGSKGTFWPANGPAIVHRMNRLMVGVAASGNLSPGGNTWLDSLVGNTSVLANITTLGTVFSGINAASRTTDTSASGLSMPSGGTAGGYFFGYNDDPTQNNIALGTNSVGIAKVGTKGIVLGAQQDIDTAAVPGCVSNPTTPLCASGSTAIGLLVTPGAYGSLATQNPNAAVVINGGAGPVFTKGMIFAANTLAVTQGAGGKGVAVEMQPGMSLRWYDGTTVFAETGTTSTGVFGLTTNSAQWSINGVASVSCPANTVNLTTFTVTNGVVTHC